MSEEREKRIAEFRRAQPIEELERKWNKARGRWTNHYWATECLDLAYVRGTEMSKKFKELMQDD